MPRRSAFLVSGSLLLALLAACTDDAPTSSPEPSKSRTPTASSSPSDPRSPKRSSKLRMTLKEISPVSLPALFGRPPATSRVRIVEQTAVTDAYRQYSVTYRSGRFTISGRLNVPLGRGPFPALVLAHGYIDPAIYVNGQGLMREQDYLARAGYVVLHTDYRNHAFSDDDPNAERRMRLGYTTDVINAVRALRRSDLPVDDDRVGLLGRSMGGGVVYNVLVAKPGLVDAAAVFAPVSSRTPDNFNRWIRDDPGRSALSDHILSAYGEPREERRSWRELSPRTYFDRITEPVLIHHGTADDTCPLVWSRTTQTALRTAGVDSRLYVYPGEQHAFINLWPLSMQRTVSFFRRTL